MTVSRTSSAGAFCPTLMSSASAGALESSHNSGFTTTGKRENLRNASAHFQAFGRSRKTFRPSLPSSATQPPAAHTKSEPRSARSSHSQSRGRRAKCSPRHHQTPTISCCSLLPPPPDGVLPHSAAHVRFCDCAWHNWPRHSDTTGSRPVGHRHSLAQVLQL